MVFLSRCRGLAVLRWPLMVIGVICQYLKFTMFWGDVEDPFKFLLRYSFGLIGFCLSENPFC